jgi:hypothetical protein
VRLPNGIPEECAQAPGGDQPALQAVYLRGGFLEATDSYRMVRVPVVRDEGDQDGPIHPDALRLARERGRRLDCSREHHTVIPGFGGINRPTLETDQAPTFESLAESNTYEPMLRIALNAKFLLGIAEAFGVTNVILEVPPTTEYALAQAIRVVPTQADGCEAFLMPVALPRPSVSEDEE